MKYIVFYECEHDTFTDEFDDKLEAVKAAFKDWNRFCESDKARAKGFYVLESADPDEDSERHWDGDIVVDVKNFKYYTANKETGMFIEAFDSLEEALSAIRTYEETDKADDCYEPYFYDVVDSEHCSIEAHWPFSSYLEWVYS